MTVIVLSIASSLLLAMFTIASIGVNHLKKDVRLFSWLIYLAAIGELVFMSFSFSGIQTFSLVSFYTLIEVILTLWLLYAFCGKGNNLTKKLIIAMLLLYVFGAASSVVIDYENAWFLDQTRTLPYAALIISISAIFAYYNTAYEVVAAPQKDYRRWVLIGLLLYHLIGSFLVFSISGTGWEPGFKDIYMIQQLVTILHNILYAVAIIYIRRDDITQEDNKDWLTDIV